MEAHLSSGQLLAARLAPQDRLELAFAWRLLPGEPEERAPLGPKERLLSAEAFLASLKEAKRSCKERGTRDEQKSKEQKSESRKQEEGEKN